MQQRCTNCGAFIQPGSGACGNCGAPVSSGAPGMYGSGAYDPTVRAGGPPNPGYGPPSYGAPSAPPPYGAQQPPYGASQPSYGSSPYGAPPNPGYGTPPNAGYGTPMQAPAGYPVMQPAQKSRRGLYVGLAAVIILVIVVVAALASGLGKFKQQVTTGTHITQIQTGTGFDEQNGAVIGKTDTFHSGDTIHIVFTVKDADQGAILTIKLYQDGSLEHTSAPHTIDSGTNVYDYSVSIDQTGEHKAEIDYNGNADGSITFNVT
jgi:hypothetical protein